MASVSYWQASWVDEGEAGLLPGGEHNWVMWGFGYGDAINVTAAPLNSDVGDQILAVESIRTEADSGGGRRFFFTIRNIGPVRALGYGMNISFISS